MNEWIVDIDKVNYLETYPDVRVVNHPNYADLRREIMCFNTDIKWDGMWTYEDAIERLGKGWIFVCLFIDHQIKGWLWYNPKSNLFQNIYVNKEYRKMGYAQQLFKRMCKECQSRGIKEVRAYVDEWNVDSSNILKTNNSRLNNN